MKRNGHKPPDNLFLAWTDLAWKIGEMSIASAEVIAHRTARMTAAGPMPSARDRREFALMGREKFDASMESARATTAFMSTAYLKFAERALRYMLTGTSALTALAASRTVDQFIARHANLADTVSRSAITASELSHSTIRLAGRGLKPLHARATANAKRLARR
jgi:hypothetical protein